MQCKSIKFNELYGIADHGFADGLETRPDPESLRVEVESGAERANEGTAYPIYRKPAVPKP